ncbi:MAG: hypothetical protein ABFS17_09510 [Chloroflexota bacterium]
MVAKNTLSWKFLLANNLLYEQISRQQAEEIDTITAKPRFDLAGFTWLKKNSEKKATKKFGCVPKQFNNYPNLTGGIHGQC